MASGVNKLAALLQKNRFLCGVRRINLAVTEEMSSRGGQGTVACITKSIMAPMKNEKYRKEGGRITKKQDLEEFVRLYKSVPDDEKKEIMLSLSKVYGTNQDMIFKQCQVLMESHTAITQRESSTLRAEQKLKQLLKPSYYTLLTQLGTLKDGVKFLIDVRCDTLYAARNETVIREDVDYLMHLSEHIKEILSMWFSVGLLQLQRITWETSADILEKLAKYEAVHAVKNWLDLKHRLGPNRRCYAFFHGNMPKEPVIVLHVALTGEISDNIGTILNYRLGDENVQEMENATDAKCAIFYSITSTQKGLQGIELGAYLIQAVVDRLKAELPQLAKFSSLSPIPGFRKWLVSELNDETAMQFLQKLDIAHLEDAKRYMHWSKDLNSFLKHILKNLDSLKDVELASKLKQPMIRLCAAYICKIKRRNCAFDSVANFHLKNGAVVWRINWMADVSATGMQQSCGLMVNYRYYLKDMAENSGKYITTQAVPVSDLVKPLLCEDLRSNL